MSFLSGNILWNLLWIMPLILVLAIAGGVRRKKLLRKMFGTDERAARFSNASSGKRVFRIILLSLAVLLLAVAAARPSWGKQIMQDTSTGRDLLVLFDVSRSMLSDDVKPSRMDHAKWLVREIVKKNPGDRFGLIAFAGESFLVCPLTVDRASFIRLVDDLDTDTIPVGGTNVQLALEEAVKAFEGAQGTHKAVVLVTDGDELTGRGASVVGDLAKADIPIFAVGVGDPSTPAVIRVKDEDGKLRILTDRDGNPVKSPLNEPQLTELARRTGGIYVRSTAAYSGIDELETRIKMLDRKESENAVSTFRPIERPAYPLSVAIILLVIFFCVSETRPRSIQSVLALAALLLFATPAESRAQAAVPAPAKTQQAQSAAPAEAAEPAAEQPAPEPVRTATELYNSGLEQQQVEHDDEKARTFYERAIAASEKEPLVRASSYQNIGVISHLDARSSLQGATEKLQAQDLNSAGKAVDEAIVKLNRAEELYRESMRSAEDDATVVRNQRILIADRKQAEEMKKQIEDLKKLMEQARQQTQQAHDQQQQENQQQDQQQQDQQDGEQDQQQQDQQDGEQDQQQQDQQDGEQDQQQQDQQDGEQDQQQQQSGEQDQQQQQDQQSAQDKTRQAEETVSELEQKASEMNQERQKQAAQEAREELQKAREEQEQGNGEKAEEHLKNALDTLNQNQQDQQDGEQDQKQDRQSGEQDRQDDDQQQDGEQGEPEQQPRQRQENMQEAQEEQGDMDKQQAEAILNMMSKDELDFKDANQMRRPARQNNRVEKDW
jgi:Ca-activated chloride channel family protein